MRKSPTASPSLSASRWCSEPRIRRPPLLARILWLTGFPDQASVAAREAVETARNSGRSFPICYALTQAGVPVALWTGDRDEARRMTDLLVAHGKGVPRIDQWSIC